MGIEMPDINKIREEIDKKNTEIEEKEREKIKEEYERSSEQEKPTEGLIKDKKDEGEKSEVNEEEGKKEKIKDEDIIQKLTPENIKAAANFKAAYEKGKFVEVKVKISPEEIEEGWVISNINPKTGEATVLKSTSGKGKNRSFIDKIVTLEELKEWNKPETKDEVGPEEKPTEAKQKDKIEGKTKEESKKETKGKNKKEGNRKKEDLEKNLIERYDNELEEIKQMPDDTRKLKKTKAIRCFELIDHWKNLGHLDDYKGVLNTFSELNGLESSIFLYDADKADIINDVCLAMAENYKKWDLGDKKKLKTIKNFVGKESKKRNLLYSKNTADKTFNKIAETLALENVPFKGNIDIIVENIENPNIKSKTLETILEIENKPIEEKEELLERMGEGKAKEKMSSEEKIKKMGASEEMMKALENPKIMSQLFTEGSKILAKGSEILKNPEAQKKTQELNDVIKKIVEEEGKEKIPDCVTEAAKLIKGDKGKEKKDKKESPWGAAFGTIGFSILLFLVIFMLAELKAVDYFSGQATGEKKKK